MKESHGLPVKQFDRFPRNGFEDKSGRWVPPGHAAKLCGCRDSRPLGEWAIGCEFLPHRRVRGVLVRWTSKRGRQQEQPFFLERDCLRVREFRAKIQAPSPLWVTAQEASVDADLGTPSRRTLENWWNDGIPQLGGMKLPSRLEWRLDAKGAIHQCRVYKRSTLLRVAKLRAADLSPGELTVKAASRVWKVAENAVYRAERDGRVDATLRPTSARSGRAQQLFVRKTEAAIVLDGPQPVPPRRFHEGAWWCSIRKGAAVYEFPRGTLDMWARDERSPLLLSDEALQVWRQGGAIYLLESQLAAAKANRELAMKDGWKGFGKLPQSVSRDKWRRGVAPDIATSPRRSTGRLVLRLDCSQVVLDGEPYQLSADGALFLDYLIRAGGAWVSGKTMAIKRPSRVRQGLPAAIKLTTDASERWGYRLLPGYL